MKRGASGLSLVVGVNKPIGMSSHDVVNRCRRIFGEHRVGHTGTLDPLATGALLVCVGPATRLDAYLSGHDKHYRVRISFGASTTTDDAAGEVVRTGAVPSNVLDGEFAAAFVAGLVGEHRQMPPAYSAIKVNGTKACDAARKGVIIDLAPRDIQVYEAKLLEVIGSDGDGRPSWDVSFYVSKGTYIRSLARDVGVAVGCPAHVGALERTTVGSLQLDECVTLETLEQVRERAALDPIELLGHRFSYLDEGHEDVVRNGSPMTASDFPLFERRRGSAQAALCACTAGVRESREAPRDGEIVSVIARNRLAALYAYDEDRALFRARCVFQTGVSRGSDI